MDGNPFVVDSGATVHMKATPNRLVNIPTTLIITLHLVLGNGVYTVYPPCTLVGCLLMMRLGGMKLL